MTATTVNQTIQEAIQENAEAVIRLRRHFHQYPEASLKEFQTIKKSKKN